MEKKKEKTKSYGNQDKCINRILVLVIKTQEFVVTFSVDSDSIKRGIL
jgi:hypothetical protein